MAPNVRCRSPYTSGSLTRSGGATGVSFAP